MNSRKTVSVILALVMMLFLPVTGLAEGYSDIRGHWAKSAIEDWDSRDIIQGYEGKFNPDNPITRAELATVLDRLMGYTKISPGSFSDLRSDAWYNESLLRLNAAGVIQGSDGRIRPDDRVTRQEAAVMLGRALRLDTFDGATGFTDDSEIASWARGFVGEMSRCGYINGYPDGRFGPRDSISRAEIVQIIDNMIPVYILSPGSHSFSDSGVVQGIAVIRFPDVSVSNLSVSGGLFISPGAAGGKVTLDGLSADGPTTVQGCDNTVIEARFSSFSEIRILDSDTTELLLDDSYRYGEITLPEAKPSFSLSFDLRGGRGSVPEPAAYAENAVAKIPSGTPSKDNCTFMGWSSAPDYSGSFHLPGESIKITGAVTLYAVWSSDGQTPQTPVVLLTPEQLLRI